MYKKIIISAFNIHTGGGFTLLNEILNNNESAKYFDKLILDERTRKRFHTLKLKKVFAKKKIFSRLFKFLFYTSFIDKNKILFCFNGLPPFFNLKCKVVVYLQTFYFTERPKSYSFPPFVSLRIFFEKIWFWFFYDNIDEIWVQTNHIKLKLLKVIKIKKLKTKKIKIVPFVSKKIINNLKKKQNKKIGIEKYKKNFTLFYPSDLSAHKNHINLISAFIKLKSKVQSARLYLTLTDKDFKKLLNNEKFVNSELVGIINLGNLDYISVLKMYKKSILIFPSFDETFGLPLIEASSLGTPIIASNRSFVKEICKNTYLFNPISINSIYFNMIKCFKNPLHSVCVFEKKNIFDGNSFINHLVT